MARLLMRAIAGAGHHVVLGSRLRTFDGSGDAEAQTQFKIESERQVAGLLDAYAKETVPAPELWFTYHLYHKAPDWIGPAVAKALSIPYVVSEASVAPKQAGGPWDMGHRAVLRALHQADLVIGFNDIDAVCVSDVLSGSQRYERLPPFVDIEPYTDAAANRSTYRAMAAGQYGLPTGVPWLMTVAMMRPGDKTRSYRLLSDTLGELQDEAWHLLVVGDGTNRREIRDAFAPIGDRVHWLGQLDTDGLPGLYAAADIYVWPALNEAYGMSFLEAQSSGLPVIAGNDGGVPGVVHAPEAGILVATGDTHAFATAVRSLLHNPDSRRAIGTAAQSRMRDEHSLFAASRTLDRLLHDVREKHPLCA
ncbi:MAG: glycosyltransferase family 4 protein [Rhodospirillales bacterium]